MLFMENLKPVIQSTISITDFIRNVTDSLNSLKNGAKVIMKNNKPEAVIMTPQEYVDLIDRLEDAEDLSLAIERTKKHNKNTHYFTEKEIMEKYHISEGDLKGFEEVEIE